MLTAVKRKNSVQRQADAAEVEHYFPELDEEIRECLADMRHNEMMFNLETAPDLVEQRIYERQALRCRYRYLLECIKKRDMSASVYADAKKG